MIYRKKNLWRLLLACSFYFFQLALYSQNTDTIPKKSFNDYINTRKGLYGKVMKSLSKSPSKVTEQSTLTRNDIPYKKFEGDIIRKIIVRDLPFGIDLADTSIKVVTPYTSLANKIHHKTRLSTIRKNLFFNENDSLLPYLLADNETFLRQLPYLKDVRFQILPVKGTRDSVDIYVFAKDLFTLGGSIPSLELNNTDIEVREDNVYGSGDGLVVHGLYDMERRINFGAGIEYIQRNIAGSFINFDARYQSYYPDILGLKQENLYLVSFTKPLINRYMNWTYEFDAYYHSTRNMYSNDSVYYAQYYYRYYDFDTWVGYNINATGYTTEAEERKLRKLVAFRMIDLQFQKLPKLYDTAYDWRYANLQAILGSVSFYRQNFYKAQYVYGFGLNEDIPVGLNVSFTAGYTKKQELYRPFIGFNFQRSVFNSKDNYFSYIFRAEGYLDQKKLEDVNLLAGIDYFDHLKYLGTRWKQRTFVNIGLAKQINTILNEPLYLDSKFALPEFSTGDVGGSLRASIRAESVFYSPWYLASFSFAPFIFGNAGYFTPYNNTFLTSNNIYTIVGGGLRTRNESLIFGTLELRGYYFLQKNVYNENWRIDISTNLIFKNGLQLVSKPDFIHIN